MLPYAQSNDQAFTLTHEKLFWIQACCYHMDMDEKRKQLRLFHGSVEFLLHYGREERKI